MDFPVSRLLDKTEFGLNGESISVPSWAFTPDQWSRAFLRGLIKVAPTWENSNVWEVGVGTGINIALLRKYATNATWFLSDYNQRCVPLAIRNILHFKLTRRNLRPLVGSWDLVTPPKETRQRVPKVNVVFGCLPQVPSEENLSFGDRRAHYYNPRQYWEAHSNALGLGLNEALLQRAKKVLYPKGQVVLNLSGRPGLKKLQSLFLEAGYQPNVVWEETIPQHVGTSLASLAALETTGHHHDFEFFKDSRCTSRIGAREAEARRIKGQAIFHKIYVIAGTLVT